jgi:hypothetical protein
MTPDSGESPDAYGATLGPGKLPEPRDPPPSCSCWLILAVIVISVAICFFLVGCTFNTGPVTPPTDGPGDCGTAAQNLTALECKEANGFQKRCEDAQRADAKLGIVFPVGCITAAKSCEEADQCK